MLSNLFYRAINALRKIKLSLTEYWGILSLLLITIFTYLFRQRGSEIKKLKTDLANRDFNDQVKDLTNNIEAGKNEVKDKNRILNDRLNKFDESKRRFLRIRSRYLNQTKDGSPQDGGDTK